jgi:uncharacterized protein YukE
VTDWSILGGNPAPGSPDAFEAIAQALAPLVDHAESSGESIRAMAQQAGSSLWLGTAAQAFAESVHVIPTDLDNLVTAHQTAIFALNDYADTLSTQQQQASQVLAAALSAQSDIDSASTALSNAQDRYSAANSAYEYYRLDVYSLESEKTAAEIVHNSAEVARLEAKITTATNARNTAWTERNDASSDISSAQSARNAAESRLDNDKATANGIAGQIGDAISLFLTRMTEAADFVVEQRSWFDRVRHDFDSAARFELGFVKQVANRELEDGAAALKEADRIQHEVVKSRAFQDVVSGAKVASTVLSMAAPFLAPIPILGEVAVAAAVATSAVALAGEAAEMADGVRPWSATALVMDAGNLALSAVGGAAAFRSLEVARTATDADTVASAADDADSILGGGKDGVQAVSDLMPGLSEGSAHVVAVALHLTNETEEGAGLALNTQAVVVDVKAHDYVGAVAQATSGGLDLAGAGSSGTASTELSGSSTLLGSYGSTPSKVTTK